MYLRMRYDASLIQSCEFLGLEIHSGLPKSINTVHDRLDGGICSGFYVYGR